MKYTADIIILIPFKNVLLLISLKTKSPWDWPKILAIDLYLNFAMLGSLINAVFKKASDLGLSTFVMKGKFFLYQSL